MAFVVKENNNFTATVEVVTPDEDGHDAKWKFKATFKVITSDDVKEAGGDMVKAALVSVDGVPREEGMTDERVMEILCARGDTRNAILKTYNDQVVKKNQGSSFP